MERFKNLQCGMCSGLHKTKKVYNFQSLHIITWSTVKGLYSTNFQLVPEILPHADTYIEKISRVLNSLVALVWHKSVETNPNALAFVAFSTVLSICVIVAGEHESGTHMPIFSPNVLFKEKKIETHHRFVMKYNLV